MGSAAPSPAGSSHTGRNGWGAGDHPENSQSQELLHEMRRLRLRMGELERAAGAGISNPKGWPRPGGSASGSTMGRGNLCSGNDVAVAAFGGGPGAMPGSLQDRLGTSASSVGGESSAIGDLGRHGGGSCADSRSPDSAGVPIGALAADLQGISRPGGVIRFGRGPGSGASARSARSARSTLSDQLGSHEFSGWEYRAHSSGDRVDAAVADLVNRPNGRYRGWRALLCRLEQGVYLCGTRRVHIRADAERECIEASEDGGATWADLEDLMQGAEASQRALLERARDAAGLTS